MADKRPGTQPFQECVESKSGAAGVRARPGSAGLAKRQRVFAELTFGIHSC